MQIIFTFHNRYNEKDKLSTNDSDSLDNNELVVNIDKFYDNGNFLGNYLTYNDIGMANANNIKILYISSNNHFSDFSIINKYN